MEACPLDSNTLITMQVITEFIQLTWITVTDRHINYEFPPFDKLPTWTFLAPLTSAGRIQPFDWSDWISNESMWFPEDA